MSGGDNYPGAEWIPAHSDRYTVRGSRDIEEIVLHITEGGTDDARVTAKHAFGIPKYLHNGKWKRQAAHYIVGRDGTVVQCVLHKNIAHHVGPANEWTIGIEHNTRAGIDTTLTGRQYLNSAQLVVWLGKRLGLPINRHNVVGHSEADPDTSHSRCPGRVLNWETYMQAIEHVQAVAEGRTPMALWGYE
jgi:N-acetyl-anhydromuramyl-L-alanine amidase AmpD